MTRLVLIFGLLVALGASADVEVIDDAGHTVKLPQPARRIISLAPHLTELLFAVGAGASVVGVVQYSDYPEAAQRLPVIGSSSAVDFEAILRAKPDLIVAWKSGNPAPIVERLGKFNIPLYLSEPRQLDDVASNMERIGILAGTLATAQSAVRDYRTELQSLRNGTPKMAPLKVFYQIWDRPLITINGEHMISALLTLCGGTNVFTALPLVAPQISLEAVFAADPDVIIASGSDGSVDHGLKQWERWPSLRAVRDHRVFFVEPDWVQRPTPRILLGARRICELLEGARRQRDDSTTSPLQSTAP